MSRSAFDPPFEQLPTTLPIFPLAGVLLLPRGKLPLNIFEPRYLAMFDDAIRGDRLVGMIQPCDEGCAHRAKSGNGEPIFPVGCAGRITSFNETEDGRYLVTLTGLARFHVKDELAMVKGYRRVNVDWSAFQADYQQAGVAPIDRSRLLELLQAYFRQQGLSANWDAIESAPDEKLVTSLAMICPFASSEKQALLEATCLKDRAKVMMALLEIAVATPMDGDDPCH
ncbi:LON peptidase substrate-binding domain-containing protein [Roseiterribacter gracilis]|uniref:ATP-dependent protease n=1 Tax=Roseiterribacter gracilis TaxID=2812848 RepID=A0A8S8XH95_9PROT|nr:ATP-dependent protease [Rhodospirillales bacterium TMPK1]